MNWHYGLGFISDSYLNCLSRYLISVWLDVHKYRNSVSQYHRCSRGHKSNRRNNHLITCLYPSCFYGNNQGACPVISSYGIFYSNPFSEFSLKLSYFRIKIKPAKTAPSTTFQYIDQSFSILVIENWPLNF
ncbi:hypothetical protein ES703_86609 [subsurface metagenome]